MDKVKVSILIPVAPWHLRYVSYSLKSIEEQTFKDHEVLTGIDLYKMGSCNMRNSLFRQARGEYIALQDADDEMKPYRLKEQVEILDDNPKVDIVYSSYIMRDKDGVETEHKLGQCTRENLLEGKRIVAGQTFMMRRECLVDEKFDEKWAYAFDYEYALRCIDKFNFLYYDRPCVIYNRHGGEHLAGTEESEEQFAKLQELYKAKAKPPVA